MSENLMLSTLNKKEKEDLLYELSNFYLEYRDKLNFKEDITFGIEVEVLTNKLTEPLNHSQNMVHFLDAHGIHDKFIISKEEYDEMVRGGELISPVLTNTKENWEFLKNTIDVFKKYSEAEISYHTSGHIHIGSNVLKKGKLVKAVKLYAAFEDIIYRFAAGEYINIRPGVSSYAIPIAHQIKENNPRTDEEVINLLSHKNPTIVKRMGYNLIHVFRYNGLNFSNLVTNTNDTIEFRVPNGSLNPIIWQNNINFIVKLLKSVDIHDEDIINYYMDKIDISNVLTKNSIVKNYNQILDIEKALILADIIFDNTLDKLYFIRGYIKDGEVIKDTKEILKKSKTFTK